MSCVLGSMWEFAGEIEEECLRASEQHVKDLGVV